jgi:multimeric flavodoxin WrbA
MKNTTRTGKTKSSVEYLPERRILGVCGSPRKGGNSDILMGKILSGAKGRDVGGEGIRLRDYAFEPCIGCEKCRKDGICTGQDDGMQPLYPKILESRGLVLVSPTHNYNVTAWTKAFIDRLYCFYIFDDNRPRGWSSRLAGQGRKAVIATICEQETKKDMGFTLEAMRLPLEALGYEIIGELGVLRLFDKGSIKNEPETLAEASRLGERLAGALTKS